MHGEYNVKFYELCGMFLVTQYGTGDCRLLVCQTWDILKDGDDAQKKKKTFRMQCLQFHQQNYDVQ
jgi:hypothetical protein